MTDKQYPGITVSLPLFFNSDESIDFKTLTRYIDDLSSQRYISSVYSMAYNTRYKMLSDTELLDLNIKILKQTKQNKVINGCGTFKNLIGSNLMLADYINNTKPSRNLENLEINLMYLNFEFETQRAIDTSLLQLWADYFSHIGYQVPEDPQDWIERQLDF